MTSPQGKGKVKWMGLLHVVVLYVVAEAAPSIGSLLYFILCFSHANSNSNFAVQPLHALECF